MSQKGKTMRRTILLALFLLVPILAVVVKTTGHAGTGGGDTAASEKWEYLASPHFDNGVG